MPAVDAGKGRRWTTMRIGHALSSPFDVELEPESITQPDVFVVSPSPRGAAEPFRLALPGVFSCVFDENSSP